jgi:hypothetical protein
MATELRAEHATEAKHLSGVPRGRHPPEMTWPLLYARASRLSATVRKPTSTVYVNIPNQSSVLNQRLAES